VSSRLSVRVEEFDYHLTDFHEIWNLAIFRRSVEKVKVQLKSDKNNRHITWRLIYVFFIVSRSHLLRMRNDTDKIHRGHQNTKLMSGNHFSETRAVFELMWKYYSRTGQVTIWRMRNECWIPKATNTYSRYVLIIAVPLQQWLHERTSVLHYTYIACLFVS
jgi:hypothetical protein